MPFDGADFDPSPRPAQPPRRPKVSKREETVICIVVCILALVLVLTPISIQTLSDVIGFLSRR